MKYLLLLVVVVVVAYLIYLQVMFPEDVILSTLGPWATIIIAFGGGYVASRK